MGTARLLLDGLGGSLRVGQGDQQSETRTQRGHLRLLLNMSRCACSHGAAKPCARHDGNLPAANVTVIEAPVDDIWMRDIAPTFAVRRSDRDQEVVAVDWNFNGWGGTGQRPQRAGDRLAKTAASIFGVPRISVRFVAEGGALITDGRGTMITTRSCLLNPNRNPVRSGRDRRTLSKQNWPRSVSAK